MSIMDIKKFKDYVMTGRFGNLPTVSKNMDDVRHISSEDTMKVLDMVSYIRGLNKELEVSFLNLDNVMNHVDMTDVKKWHKEKLWYCEISLTWKHIGVAEVYYDYNTKLWSVNNFKYNIDICRNDEQCVYPRVMYENIGNFGQLPCFKDDEIKDKVKDRVDFIEGFIDAWRKVEAHNNRIKKLTEIKCAGFDTSEVVYT